jgi:hypothetical protein
MRGHAGVLAKCAQLAPQLDYKLLLQANSAKASEEEVVGAMQHLEAIGERGNLAYSNPNPNPNWKAIVERGNVAYLSKLLAKIKKLKEIGLEGSLAGHLHAVLLLHEAPPLPTWNA